MTRDQFLAKLCFKRGGRGDFWSVGVAATATEVSQACSGLEQVIAFHEYESAFSAIAKVLDDCVLDETAKKNWYGTGVAKNAAYQALMADRTQCAISLTMAVAQAEHWHFCLHKDNRTQVIENAVSGRVLRLMFEHLSKRKQQFEDGHLRLLLRLGADAANFFGATDYLGNVIRIVERSKEKLAVDEQVRVWIKAIRARIADYVQNKKTRTLLNAMDDLTGDVDVNRFSGDGPGEIRANALLDAAQPASALHNLLRHALDCHATKPSEKWLKQSGEAIQALGQEESQQLMLRCLRAISHANGLHVATVNYRDISNNVALLNGLVWIAATSREPELAIPIGDLAELHSRGKIEERLLRFPVAGACLRALAWMKTPAALAQLSRLELRIRWPKARKLVRKLFDEAVAASGMQRDDVVEALVPDFGIKEGNTAQQFGDCTAMLALCSSDRPMVTWTLSDGKAARTIPKVIKTAYPVAAETVKQLANDIENMRAAQRARLDLLFRRTRSWRFSEWLARYLDHGLVSSLARRLIWVIDSTAVIYRDGQLVDISGTPTQFGQTADVRLWHPIHHSIEQVVAWRNRLNEWGITQPFKQAHREVYPLTAAERNTDTYSNRFAAHILKGGTMLAISQTRGWKAGLFGGAGSSPSLILPDYGLVAEWWVQAAGDAYTPFGSPLYLSTDQVRFHREGDPAPVPLDQIPPLVFSEIMRDVDLFVGVASVGNDPNWADGGPQGNHRDYWHSYSFGDLSASAATRKEVLQRLVPRLKIAGQCSITDKFLVVRGQKRTYKIHLGSGNILMEPNDQYLCIVPDARSRANEEKVFLPFEGDSTLSIILSKALLLSEDHKITDPTIVRQIQ